MYARSGCLESGSVFWSWGMSTGGGCGTPELDDNVFVMTSFGDRRVVGCVLGDIRGQGD